MTLDERYDLCKELAQKETDDAPIEEIIQAYYNGYLDYFDELTDEELLEAAKEIQG